MAVVNVELPFLLLTAGVVCGLLGWLLGTFTRWLRGYRYRFALGAIALPLSGLMGFFSTLKLEMTFCGDWLSEHPVSIFIGIGYLGYLLFGFLGCWTAVRIGGRIDRKHTLSELYTLLASRKKTTSN